MENICKLFCILKLHLFENTFNKISTLSLLSTIFCLESNESIFARWSHLHWRFRSRVWQTQLGNAVLGPFRVQYMNTDLKQIIIFVNNPCLKTYFCLWAYSQSRLVGSDPFVDFEFLALQWFQMVSNWKVFAQLEQIFPTSNCKIL